MSLHSRLLQLIIGIVITKSDVDEMLMVIIEFIELIKTIVDGLNANADNRVYRIN
jgi:hypothetical protein